MYDYKERLKAPNVCEFQVSTPQGHRVVIVYLDGVDARVTAFNEISNTRQPATLFLQEILHLIERSKRLIGFRDSVLQTLNESAETLQHLDKDMLQ